MNDDLQRVYDEADRIVRGVDKQTEGEIQASSFGKAPRYLAPPPSSAEDRPYVMTVLPAGARALVAALNRLEELEARAAEYETAKGDQIDPPPPPPPPLRQLPDDVLQRKPKRGRP